MTTIVLQIETSAGTKVDVPLRVGANEILAEPDSQYRLTVEDEASGASLWNPQAFRDDDDLVIEGVVDGQTLMLQDFFSVCTDPQVCQLEITPSSGVTSTISIDTQAIEVSASGRALVYDAASIQMASEDSGVNWVTVALAGGATVGLLAGAGGGGGDNTSAPSPSPGPDPAPGTTVEDPDPIRLSGTRIQSVEIEGGDQVITDTEAGPQDRLVVTLTVTEPLSEILNTDLFWDSPSGEPTQISNADFLAEADESTNTIRVSVNVYTRQNGTTVEEGNGLTELDVVLYSNGPDGSPFVSGRASIPLRMSFDSAGDTDSIVQLNQEPEPGDQQASVLFVDDLLSDTALLTSDEEASVVVAQPFPQYDEAMPVAGSDLLADQGLPALI